MYPSFPGTINSYADGKSEVTVGRLNIFASLNIMGQASEIDVDTSRSANLKYGYGFCFSPTTLTQSATSYFTMFFIMAGTVISSADLPIIYQMNLHCAIFNFRAICGIVSNLFTLQIRPTEIIVNNDFIELKSEICTLDF